MISIDGSMFEGGGQIARTALALSTILNQPFEMHSIRKGRKNPGLKAQHLECINALQKFCGAKAEHSGLGSETLIFHPGKIIPQKLEINIGTAGSITLLLQSLLIPAIFAGKKSVFTITGGTDVSWSPSIDYFSCVLLPHLTPYAAIQCKVLERGYYPKGQGKVEIAITPKFTEEEIREKKIPQLNLISGGNLLQIKGISHASAELMGAKVAERQAQAAQMMIAKLKCPIEIRHEYRKTTSPGSGITLWARFGEGKEIDLKECVLGSDALGERGKKSEDVGNQAAVALLAEIQSSACVDQHLADQLIPFLALFGGNIRMSELSEHCKANLYVCEAFLGKRSEYSAGLLKSVF